jgi:glutathione S-transferase
MDHLFQVFQGCSLFISARSPFARRVRVAFYENGIEFTEKTLDVFQPNPELWKANPLARVPAVILKNGQVLIDSNLILEVLYGTHPSPFMPSFANIEGKLAVSRISAIAAGVCEKLVEYYLEILRPAERRDQEVITEVQGILDRSFAHFEGVLSKTGGQYLVENSGQPTQADFDVAIAMAYTKLRHPIQWEEKYPRLAAHLKWMNSRPSFQKTVPPPAV